MPHALKTVGGGAPKVHFVTGAALSQELTDDWAPDLMKSRAYEQILLGVISGDLPPGARLDEQALTDRYNVGLAGVRDALGRLALEGLVVRRPRSGTTVALLDPKEVGQVFEARRLIEPHCASLAALYATEEELVAITSAFDGAEAATESRTVVVMDQRFHAAVVRAGHNPTLERIAISLQHKASRFWMCAMQLETTEQRLDEIRRHRAVGECIARRDAEGAQAAMFAILETPSLIFSGRRTAGQ